MLPMVAPWIIEQSATGRHRLADGSPPPGLCAHGCFQYAGDDAFVFVAVEDDAQWLSLCRVIDRPDLAKVKHLADSAGARRRDEAALNAWISLTKCTEDAADPNAAGRHSGRHRALSPVDLLDDPHLRAALLANGWIGTYAGSSFEPIAGLSRDRPAPTPSRGRRRRSGSTTKKS